MWRSECLDVFLPRFVKVEQLEFMHMLYAIRIHCRIPIVFSYECSLHTSARAPILICAHCRQSHLSVHGYLSVTDHFSQPKADPNDWLK